MKEILIIVACLVVVVLFASYIVFALTLDMKANYLVIKPKEEDIDTEKDIFGPTNRLDTMLINKYLPSFNSSSFEEIYIESFDHLKLYGRFIKGTNNEFIICVHGYKGSSTFCFCDKSSYYRQRGCNLLIIDNRAHGKSEGRYIGFGELDQYDVIKWIEYLNKRFENPRIFLHGLSMGGATVIHCADKDIKNVYGIIDDCGFDYGKRILQKCSKRIMGIHYFPLCSLALFWSKLIAKNDLKKSDGKEIVKHTNIPILFIHGTQDRFVPCQMSIDMYNNCASKKKLFLVKGAGHCGCYCLDQKGYEDALSEILDGKL